MDSATTPPSEQRLRDARAAGLTPRPRLVGLAAGLSALVLCGCAGMSWWSAALKGALVEALSSAQGTPALPRALGAARALVGNAAGLMLSASFVVIALCEWLGRGASLGWPSRSLRLSVARPATPWLTFAALTLVLSVAGALGVHMALRASAPSMGAQSVSWLGRVAALLAVVALLDGLLARAAFRKTLWTTPRQARAEEREQHGSREARGRRSEARRELAAELDARAALRTSTPERTP